MDTNTSNGKRCGHNYFKRARYFHGMLMTDRDFRDEQIYHDEKRKMLNRLLYGWGVVCGLKVKPTDPPSPSVIVEPGVALDCHGNEIVVCEPQAIDLTVKPCQPAKMRVNVCVEGSPGKTPRELYVVIRYNENNSDPVAVYAPGGNCDDKSCDYSRIHEGFCIEVWDTPPEVPKAKKGASCVDTYPCPSECPDPHYLLLAVIGCRGRIDTKAGQTTGNVKLNYTAARKLEKVCVQAGDSLRIMDTFTLNAKGSKTIKWDGPMLSHMSLPEGIDLNTLKIDEKAPKNVQRVMYEFKVSKSIRPGEADIGVSVPVIYGDDTLEIPPFFSKVGLLDTEFQRGSTIYSVMVHNTGHRGFSSVAQRKYVPTFELFSWLLNTAGIEQGLLSGYDTGSLCDIITSWEALTGQKVPVIDVLKDRLKVRDIEAQFRAGQAMEGVKDVTGGIEEKADVIEWLNNELLLKGRELKAQAEQIKTLTLELKGQASEREKLGKALDDQARGLKRALERLNKLEEGAVVPPGAGPGAGDKVTAPKKKGKIQRNGG